MAESSDEGSSNNRWERFSCTDDTYQCSNEDDLKPFYNGDKLKDRVIKIRESIIYIRRNKHSLNLLDDLKIFLRDESKTNASEDLKHGFDELITLITENTLEWGILNENGHFPLAKFYTTQSGTKVFKVINLNTFRDINATDSFHKITMSVFLVDFMKIELFNMCLQDPAKSNFTGDVYRGMGVHQKIVEDHKMLLKETISERFMSIPYVVQSTSNELSIAEGFMFEAVKESLKADGQHNVPLMCCYHVIEMRPDLLQNYKRRFPFGQISTIKAVDIAEFSTFKTEKEVLLVDAYGQLLHMEEFTNKSGKKYAMVHSVVLNTCRSHESNYHLGEDDKLARDIFWTSVCITKYEYGAKFCREKGGMEKDLASYEELLVEENAELQRLYAQEVRLPSDPVSEN